MSLLRSCNQNENMHCSINFIIIFNRFEIKKNDILVAEFLFWNKIEILQHIFLIIRVNLRKFADKKSYILFLILFLIRADSCDSWSSNLFFFNLLLFFVSPCILCGENSSLFFSVVKTLS